jgi:sucrose-phosphate synthase
MHILFFNPQGNFDNADSYLTEHPDFGGQLVYVKELAMAMVDAGHRADIVTRRIIDADWPEFSSPTDHYEGYGPELRIVRIPCGGEAFLAKEQLWDHMPEFVENTIDFYDGKLPDFATAHYADGGYCAALMQAQTGMQFTFTGHSLGAQKLDKLGMCLENQARMEKQFRFSRRIAAERQAMERAFRIITSTGMERNEQYSHPLYAGAVDVADDTHFAVIPPGVNTRVFNTSGGPADQVTFAKLDARLADPGRPHLLVSSRIDEKKNIAGAVAAYTGTPGLPDKAGLVICVRGIDDPFRQIDQLAAPEREVLQPVLKMISDAGLRGKVDFLNIGSQAELAATYRYFAARRSVFVLTAFYEPFGLAPIEAVACGLACVATCNGGPSEIFDDGSGVLVDPFNPDDIGRGMLEALEGFSKLAEQSGERVRRKYTWAQTAAAYLTVIRQGLDVGKATAEIPQAPDAGARILEYLA